jgi:zinc protease
MSVIFLIYLSMRYFRAFFALVFLCLPISVFAAEVKEYKLKNGLKVIILEEPKAPVATFQVWYRVGAKDEPAGKSGLSHLLEHMMFKGTAKYGPSVLSKIVQKNGGTDNAYTTKDHTVYFELFSSDRITIALDLEADRMQNLTLDDDEVISERNVVMEERRLRYEDDPQSSLFEEVVAAAFKVHPYQRPVIGWMSDLRSIERDDLYNYYRNNYSPNNAVIVIVGDVNAEKMIGDVRKTFEDIPPITKQTSRASLEPEQKGERRIFLKREAELPFILSAYHTPSFPHEDSFALEVLSYILSGGKSARLYQSLVYEQKIALYAGADYSILNNDPYLFFLYATASPGKDIKVVEALLYEEIENIRKAAPPEKEVQKAKNQIESSFIMGQDSIFLQAMKYGKFEMIGDWSYINQYIEGIRKVQPEDLTKVAKKYFREENRTVGILVPIKTARGEE